MSEFSRFLIVLTPFSPLIAAAVIWCTGSRLPRSIIAWTAMAGGCLSFLAVVVITAIATAVGEFPEAVFLFRWIELPISRQQGEGLVFAVDFSLMMDRMSLPFLLVSSFIGSVCLVSASRQSSDSRRFVSGVLLSLFGMLMFLLTTNVVAMLLFWSLAGVVSALLLGSQSHGETDIALPRRFFLMNRLSDILFLLATCLVWYEFGSLDLSHVFTDRAHLAHLSDSDSAILNAICLCVLGASIFRCAQFPLFGRIEELRNSSVSLQVLIQTVTYMPAGIYLLSRFLPLFEVCPQMQMAMGSVGALTTLLAAWIALTQRTSRSVLAYLAASLFGWMFLGLSTGQPLGVAFAIVLFVFSSLLITLLVFLNGREIPFCGTGETLSRRETDLGDWLFRCLLFGGTLLLASGMCGQLQILAAITNPVIALASPEPSATLGDTATVGFETNRMMTATLFLAMCSLFLTSFALFRFCFLTFQTTASKAAVDKTHSVTRSRTDHPIVLLLTAAVIAFAGIVFVSRSLSGMFFGGILPSPQEWIPLDRTEILLGIIIVLLGGVSARLLYREHSDWPNRIAGSLYSLDRLGQRRFYLDDLAITVFVVPVRVLSVLCAVLDRHVIEQAFDGIFQNVAKVLARVSASLQNQTASFYALSLMMAGAVLLATVLWIG